MVKKAGLVGRSAEVLMVALLAGALVLIEILIGGTRLIFSFPSYAILAAAALLTVLVGAIQFRDGNNFMPIEFLQRVDYGRRASGFYVCPNHLAGALEVLGIFGMSIVCWSRFPVWGKLLIGYASGICYVGVLL